MIDPQMLERIGAYQDPVDGQVKRHRIRNANFEYDPADPKAELKGALLAYDQQLVPHPVILPLATDPASMREAQQKAVNAGADFYHPQYGWLRWGRKRETERPENLGAGTVKYETRRVTVGNGPQPAPEAEPVAGASVAEPATTKGAKA